MSILDQNLLMQDFWRENVHIITNKGSISTKITLENFDMIQEK